MGRFSIEKSLNNPQQTNSQPGTPNFLTNWPQVFSKESIGIELPGVVWDDKEILNPTDISIITGSLEAVRNMRLNGYKVFLYFNEPLISKGRLTQNDVDARIQHLMQIFGQAGILSIEGILYSTTHFKEDLFAFPNAGMLKRAEKEFNQNYKGGYFVTNNYNGIKAGYSVGARPILINSEKQDTVLKKLDTFANKELKNKVNMFDNLQKFVATLS